MKQTTIYDSHLKLGAKMIAFAGWKMPFSYSNPAAEHLNVRQNGGLFDVSHMGEIRVVGKDSLSFLESLVPTDIASLKKGESQYSVFCNQEGGLIDDLIIYCLQPKQEYFLCVNAATAAGDAKWLESHKKDFDLEILDESSHWAMLAIQGPKALLLLQKIFPSLDFDSIQKFQFIVKDAFLFSNTGYTGEQGFEIYIPCNQLCFVWKKCLQLGQEFSIKPTGLGARDTLRLEMGYLLSGQDFDQSRNPLQADLTWLLKNPKNYVGKVSLLKQQETPISTQQKLKAFVMEENLGVPRKGYPVLSSKGENIGVVTSGAKSPSLDKMIGLAYISGEENSCFLDIRGSKVKINIVKKPFLKKGEKK